MAFKGLANIKVHPDGTITGKILDNPEIEGVVLVENGVYTLGYDTWNNQVAVEFKGKDNE